MQFAHSCLVRLAAAVAAALFMPPCADGGAMGVPCTRPFVYRAGAVNVLILPYAPAGRVDAAAQSSAAKLGTLLQIQTLFSILKYSGVGVVQLSGTPAECPPEMVAGKVLGKTRGAETTVEKGRGLILLWGKVYQENTNIYLRSYVRFLLNGVDEVLTLEAQGQPISVRLPAQSFALAPTQLTRDELAQIEGEFGRSALLYAEPRETATRIPLPIGGDAVFPYSVLETRGEWMRIEAWRGGPRGWLRARIELGQNPLTRRLPELALIEGLTGYLRMQSGFLKASPLPSPVTLQHTQAALRRYLDNPQNAGEPMAGAVARSVLGIVRHWTKDRRGARQLFDEAAALAPYSGAARNLAAGYQMYLAYSGEPEPARWRKVLDDMVAAAELDARNGEAFANLESCFRILLKAGPPPGQTLTEQDREQLLPNIASLEKIRAGLK